MCFLLGNFVSIAEDALLLFQFRSDNEMVILNVKLQPVI